MILARCRVYEGRLVVNGTFIVVACHHIELPIISRPSKLVNLGEVGLGLSHGGISTDEFVLHIPSCLRHIGIGVDIGDANLYVESVLF